jgi:hypothetical protein
LIALEPVTKPYTDKFDRTDIQLLDDPGEDEYKADVPERDP